MTEFNYYFIFLNNNERLLIFFHMQPSNQVLFFLSTHKYLTLANAALLIYILNKSLKFESNC